MYKPFLLIAFMCMISFTKSQKLNLIPYPQKVEIQEHFYTIPKEIIFEKGISKENYKLYRLLFEKHHINTEISSDPKKSNISFRKLPSKTSSKKGFYQLNLLPSNTVQIYSYDDTGSFYAIQTLLQLIATSENGKIPSLEMTDEPKFDYRGMHLDVSRHFFSAEEVKKYLDYLAAYKYNKFHWHLTDDQGWRIEIKKYPKLTEIGAFRNGSQVGPYSDLKFDTIRYGGFYTQQEIKDIVAYAKALHIDIIPEIEMPGHSVAAIASYPELSCLKGNFEVSQKWGVEENILCPSEYTFKFLENVLDEIIELFPYEYIHIGGDEAPKTVWKESDFVQKKIKELGLKDEHEMQSYFITRIEKYLNSKGRKIIGWDEILEGGLAPNATVMSWTGIKGGIQAAKSEHKAIMTPNATNYFDHYQGNPDSEPLAFGGNTRLDKVYHYEPVPKELNAEEAKYIWGSQGNVWTEYIPNFKQVEYMIFPRMMALSEVVWGTAEPAHYQEFQNRVVEHFKILDRLEINYSKAIFEVTGKALPSENGKLKYQLSSAGKPENIRYTLNDTVPTISSNFYFQPIEISENAILKAAYFEGNEIKSPLFTQSFEISKSTARKITLENQPAETYSTGGAFALVDGIKGSQKNFGTSWLGFSGQDVVATIDLEEPTTISQIRFNTLDRQGSWIYPASSATIWVSDDNVNFKKVASAVSEDIEKNNGNLAISFPEIKTRYVKVKINNLGIIPKGKEGAGNKAWLFVDEISIY